MRRSSAVALSLTLLLIGSGCRSRPRITVTPKDVAGTYMLERAGRTLGQSWSVRSLLTLEHSSAFVLDIRVRTPDESSDELESGTFRIERDKIVLRSEKNETTELSVRGDSLVGKVDWPGRLFSRWAGGAPVYVKQRTH